ncbi:DUF2158 domain-containing protein [uncultured Pontibacter sp.]|uniref:DUF2158 domain-containing protein n=1 Tax=uncultured Pontibacter sp. TaxID=453356 RepID=UPI00260D415B|nr:DUF2158 domain-containing protein [uncultured Pontibacter sp.]
MTEQENKFKEGDIVRVKGLSGPMMSVQRHTTYGTNLDPEVRCSWFDTNNHLHEGNFNPDTLELRDASSKAPQSNFLYK